LNEKEITIYEWVEAFCPYCRYVYYSVLRDLQVRRKELNTKLVKQGHFAMPPLEIELIDIHGNQGNAEMQWFKIYSQKIGGIYTPAIRVGKSAKVYYMWGQEKKEQLEEKALSATDKLKSDILQEIQDILLRVDRNPLMYDKNYYNNKKLLHTPRPKIMYTPHGGIESCHGGFF